MTLGKLASAGEEIEMGFSKIGHSKHTYFYIYNKLII